MAKWVMGKGIDEYIQKLQRLGESTEEVCGEAVYEMAAVVADAIKENINALPAESEAEGIKAYQEGTSPPITIAQKRGLRDGFGISPMETTNGYMHVKLGFDGYNDLITKKYPQGQPNAMIARSIESGSSIRQKTPFIRPAVNKTKQSAIDAGKAVIDKKTEAIMKEK